MKKFIYFLIFCFLLLLIGRNLTFLPKFDFRSDAQKTTDLKNKVLDFTSKQKGTFSIYYKDIKTDKGFGVNENKILTGASLNKVYIAAYFYYLTRQKKINPEEKVVIQENDIQDYGSGILRYEGLGKAYSLKTLAELSLEKSDNTAAYVLATKLGMENIQKYIKELGIEATDMNNNKTTAKDIGTMFLYIYKNKISDPSYTHELLDFMKDTDYEDRLPRYLKEEKGVKVFHKTGDEISIIHDAGIIDDGKNPFVLAVLANDFEKEEDVKIAIGKIAKILYDNR